MGVGHFLKEGVVGPFQLAQVLYMVFLDFLYFVFIWFFQVHKLQSQLRPFFHGFVVLGGLPSISKFAQIQQIFQKFLIASNRLFIFFNLFFDL